MQTRVVAALEIAGIAGLAVAAWSWFGWEAAVVVVSIAAIWIAAVAPETGDDR